MSGLIAPESLDVWLGLGLDIAWKTTVPLAVGLVLSVLPGTAAAKHGRLVAACTAVPVLAVLTVWMRGNDAVMGGVGAWPIAVWALGATVVAAGLLRALLGLYRLPNEPLDDGLLQSSAVHTPIVTGWWRPRIVVPVDFRSWPVPSRNAALAHERAHVRRRDWLVHIGAWALSALLWFHPLMWWTRRRLALLAECAADDAVLSAGHDPATYAEQLLNLGRPAPHGALAVSSSRVGVRIRAVLDDRPRSGLRLRTFFAAAFVVLGCSVAVSGFAAWEPPPPVFGCLP